MNGNPSRSRRGRSTASRGRRTRSARRSAAPSLDTAARPRNRRRARRWERGSPSKPERSCARRSLGLGSGALARSRRRCNSSHHKNAKETRSRRTVPRSKGRIGIRMRSGRARRGAEAVRTRRAHRRTSLADTTGRASRARIPCAESRRIARPRRNRSRTRKPYRPRCGSPRARNKPARAPMAGGSRPVLPDSRRPPWWRDHNRRRAHCRSRDGRDRCPCLRRRSPDGSDSPGHRRKSHRRPRRR